MAEAIINRIVRCSGLPMFDDAAPFGEGAEFRRLSLVYGFNGTGKTTLSRVLAGLGSADSSPHLPESHEYSAVLSSGETVTARTENESLAHRMFVFNRDYVEANINWRQGRVAPIFTIGAAEAEWEREAATVRSDLQRARSELTTARREREGAEKGLKGFRRVLARNITELLGLGREYTAPNVEADYGQGAGSSTHIIDDPNRREHLVSVVRRPQPPPTLEPIATRELQLAAILAETRQVAESSPGKLALERLADHEAMLPWIGDGYQYHAAHHLSDCLFCGSTIPSGMLDALAELLAGEQNVLLGDVDHLASEVERLTRLALDIRTPHADRLLEGPRPAYSEAQVAVEGLVRRAIAAASDCGELLSRKRAAPSEALDTSGLLSDSDALAIEQQLSALLGDMNRRIREHNDAAEGFAQAQALAIEALKRHVLAEASDEHEEHVGGVDAAGARLTAATASEAQLSNRLLELEGMLREHGPAARHINQALHSQLGHAELSLVATDEGYQLHRSGAPSTSPPSEGECAALALSYFLVQLGASTVRTEDQIVVFDDPVSSLDTTAMSKVFVLVRRVARASGQCIILTHNLHFMNEHKRWLAPFTESGLRRRNRADTEPTAALLFMKVRLDGNLNRRQMQVVAMPKLLREYDTEYQYLYQRILAFLQVGDPASGDCYLLPNAMRKVLETFMAFKRPGSEGLSSKLDATLNELEGAGTDTTPFRALERLAHVQSHGEVLTCLEELPTLSIEETAAAASSLVALMRLLDEGHAAKMDRVCRV